MKFCKSGFALLLSCILGLMAFSSCGTPQDTSDNPNFAADTAPAVQTRQNDQPVQTAPESSETLEEEVPETSIEVPVSKTKEDGSSDIRVTIQSAEISLDDLKNQNYVVPVYVTLDENVGISYAEWGASYDPRCRIEQDSDAEDMRFDIVCSINEEACFFWTAWASATVREKGGNLLLLNVTLPKDAAPGDSYYVNYAPMSLAGLPHVWESPDINYVTDGYVSWMDGTITVTE